MRTSARITTVIPTYHRAALLRRAVGSALAQGGDEIVVRVLDNASPDATEAQMRQWSAKDRRLVYHRHENNIGPVANFEFGLSSVETEFFSILSDDDYLLPGFYAKALAVLDSHPEAMFWAGTTLHVTEDGVVVEARVEQWARHGVFGGQEGVMAMTHGRAPTWTGIVFRRAVLERFGLPDREALGPADLDFVLRSAAHFPFIIDTHPSAVFTLNAASFSATQPLSSFWPGWLRLVANVRAWRGLDEEAREAVAEALEQDARRMLFRRGIFALVNGRLDFARDATSALMTTPHGRWKGIVLEAALHASRIPVVRAVIAWTYRHAEARILRSRVDLQRRHGHLLQPVLQGDAS